MNPMPTPTNDRRRAPRAALLAPLLCCTLALAMTPAHDASATPGAVQGCGGRNDRPGP